jgi:hypothetical protein
VNRLAGEARRSGVATASDEQQHGSDTELAGAVHLVLATLTDLRTDMPVTQLQDRIALVQWLQDELVAVETLLVSVQGRRTATTADAGRVPGTIG